MLNKKSKNNGIFAILITLFVINIFILMPYLIYSGSDNILFASSRNVGEVKKTPSRIVFVGGAVDNEGFYEITSHATYEDIFKLCKPTEDSYTSTYYRSQFVEILQDKIIIDYFYTLPDGTLTLNSSVDVNGSFDSLKAKLIFAGLEDDTIDKIITFLIYNNEFEDKTQLKSVIGEEAFLVHGYKLFVY